LEFVGDKNRSFYEFNAIQHECDFTTDVTAAPAGQSNTTFFVSRYVCARSRKYAGYIGLAF